MKENDRIDLINEMKESFKYIHALDKINEDLLNFEPIYLKYIKLKKEVEYIKEKSLENPKWYSDFNEFFKEEIRNSIDKSECEHDILAYNGSFIEEIDPSCFNIVYLNVKDNESNEKFDHNAYICLDCGTRIRAKDYKEFEKNHCVIKTYDKSFDLNYYTKLYYQYLLTMTAEEARKKLVDTFNKKYNNTNEKNKVLIKK